MVIFLTALLCIILWFVETWVLPFVAMFTIMPLAMIPFTSFIRWKPLQMDEAFASEHPGRYHIATFLFKSAKFITACAIPGITVLGLVALQHTALPIFWPVPYVLAILVSFQFLPTRSNSGTWFTSYSHRLAGGYSEMRSSYAARLAGSPPEEVLAPIKTERWRL